MRGQPWGRRTGTAKLAALVLLVASGCISAANDATATSQDFSATDNATGTSGGFRATEATATALGFSATDTTATSLEFSATKDATANSLDFSATNAKATSRYFNAADNTTATSRVFNAPARNPAFSYYVLALYWPPATFTDDGQEIARQLIGTGEASPGFWTHGLWPARTGKPLGNCSGPAYDPEATASLERSLSYYQRSTNPSWTGLHKFWEHEWTAHGTCSGLDQLSYFLDVFKASTKVDLLKVLTSAGIKPSSGVAYPADKVEDALDKAYPGAVLPNKGLVCSTTPSGTPALSEVRLCVDPSTVKPIDCSDVARERRLSAGPALSACPTGPGATIGFPKYRSAGAGGVPWGLLLGFAATAAVVLLALAALQNYLYSKGIIPDLFLPKKVVVVQYGLVHKPVTVVSEKIEMDWMWKNAPGLADFVEDLPVGMGIKGGIARKLLKVKYGTPEKVTDKFDIDCLIFVNAYSPEIRLAMREVVTGMKLGGLVLEAQDIEVLSRDWLHEYFLTRDVTQNEVCLVKVAAGETYLWYTQDAVSDIRANLIRPVVHTLKTEFALSWNLDEWGRPYICPSQICRSLVRYLKGHGTDYAFDENTWAYYRRNKLTKIQLFKVLRPFHAEGPKLQEAVDHLVSIGFLDRKEVRRAGGVNRLWGLLLMEVNEKIARYGGRLTLTEMDPEAVERWVDQKKATVATLLLSMAMKARRTGFAPSDESAADLGLLTFPPELVDYVERGTVFDGVTFLRQSAHTAVDRLTKELKAIQESAIVSANVPAKFASMQWRIGDSAARDRESASTATRRDEWRSMRDVAADASNVLRIAGDARDASGTPEIYDGILTEATRQDLGKLRKLLSVDKDKQNTDGKPIAESPPLVEFQARAKETNKRRNRGARLGLQKLSGGKGDFKGAGEPPGAEGSGAVYYPPEVVLAERLLDRERMGLANVTRGGDVGDMREAEWLSYGTYGQALTQADALPGTFYQMAEGPSDLGAWLGGGEESGFTPIVVDEDMPRRKVIDIGRIARFLLGVLALGWGHLLLAYVLLMAALAFRLCLPRVEGRVFDAFNNVDSAAFHHTLILAAQLVLADTVIGLAGRCVLEMFARNTMREVFQRFFQHLIYQELSFFTRLSTGELMARTSGDSLTLRQLVSVTAYQLVEGIALFAGSLAFMIWSAGGVIWSAPSMVVLFIAVLSMDVVEAWAFGKAARKLNLRVRQSLGRMFGFTLDAFSQIPTVGALNMEARLISDYRLFARDYFANTVFLNVALAGHRSFTYVASAALRFGVLWAGSRALFGGVTSVGALFALLRYLSWLQRGVKQFSDGYARLMASAGSVERVVELHDRGTFGDPSNAKKGGKNPLLGPRDSLLHPDMGDDDVEEPLLPAGGRGAGEDVPASFQGMMGGCRLLDVNMQDPADSSVMLFEAADLEVLSGQICLVVGESPLGLAALVTALMLQCMPSHGFVEYQIAGVPGAEAGFSWQRFDFERDVFLDVRKNIAMGSLAACGIFHASLEDNLACATPETVTQTDAREAAEAVCLHEWAQNLPDGYRTLVGSGTGHALTRQLALQLGLARMLLRRPKLVLLDDADLFAEAVGADRLQEVLQKLADGGAAVIVAALSDMRFEWVTRVVELRAGRFWPR